mmetsp:Transcript_15911/g.45758  ORF Transcript_15911/g.45758 Transcript_15911/m.45758 type:complete len:841 (-) Transcript_15911:59-2581(-)
MEFHDGSDDSEHGGGLPLLNTLHSVEKEKPIDDSDESHIFNVHLIRHAESRKSFGLANALAMGVQDVLPILFEHGDDGSQEKAFLWRNTETTFCILGGNYMVDPLTPPFKRRQLIELWGKRYSVPTEIASIAVPSIDELKAMRKKEHRIKPPTCIYDLHCDLCSFCVDCVDPTDPTTKVVRPMVFHLPARTKSKEDLAKQKKGRSIASLSIEDLLKSSQYFDTMSVRSISNSLAHTVFCKMNRPRHVAHVPMLELADSSVTRRIAAVRSGDEVTFRPLLPPSHEFENRYSCIGYHAKHYAALELIVNEKTVVVYEGLSAESSFKDLSTYLLYKYSIVDVDIDVIKLSVIIVLCRAHVVRAAEKKAKQIDNAGPVMNVIIEALQKITYIPHLSMAIANLSVLIAILETEEVLLDVNDESQKGKPKKEGANGERAIRKNIGIKLKQFIQKKAMELTTPVSEATACDEAQDNRKFTQIHEDVVKAAKNSLVANLFVAWRDLDRSESKSNSKSKPKSKPKSKSTSKSKSKSSNEGEAGDECEDDDDDVADADADGSPHFISCYCVIGYQDNADGSGDIDDKGKMYSYSHKQEKTASIPCKLSGEKGGKTLVKNPVFNKKAAEYLRWWMMRIAYVCPGLLAIHKRLTNTTVKGNNQLSESIMKAIKIESNVRLHSSGIGEYILYANREMDADVIKAVQQISQLPSRTRKRNQLRASRSSKLAAVIEEIDEEEESKWNRTPGQEFESNKLRQELKSLEEKEGRVQGSEIYESISDWISKEKGLVRHELTSRGELMSISTFLKWYLREGMLGKKKKWKENLEGYIDKGPTEPMTKKAKKSPVKAGGR